MPMHFLIEISSLSIIITLLLFGSRHIVTLVCSRSHACQVAPMNKTSLIPPSITYETYYGTAASDMTRLGRTFPPPSWPLSITMETLVASRLVLGLGIIGQPSSLHLASPSLTRLTRSEICVTLDTRSTTEPSCLSTHENNEPV